MFSIFSISHRKYSETLDKLYMAEKLGKYYYKQSQNYLQNLANYWQELQRDVIVFHQMRSFPALAN